jgi:hypothetical protein
LKLKGRKATVFVVNGIVLIALFILMIFYAPEILSSGIGSTIIISFVLNGAAFIGGNSFDKYTISKYYNPNLIQEDKDVSGN